MDGGKQNERGKMLMRAVGMAGKNGRQTKHSLLNSNCRQHRLLNKATQATQPADSPPGTGLKQMNGPQLAGLAAKTTAA